MKNLIIVLLAVLSIGNAYAQKGKKPAKAEKKTEAAAAKRADHLKKELGLSDEQRARVKTAIETKNTKFKAIKARYKDSANKKGMGQELQTVRTSFQTEMNSILTPEQKQKYDAMKKDGKDDDDDEEGDDDDDKADKPKKTKVKKEKKNK